MTTAVTATIQSGGSQSNGVAINGNLVGLYMPSSWTTAPISFLASQDGETFYPVYDDGVERQIASPSAGAYLALSLNDWLGVSHLKVRSGTASSPVAQDDLRTLSLILAGS